MPFPIIPFLTTAAIWLGRIGLAAFAINEVKKLSSSQKDTIATATQQAEAAGLSEDEQKKLIAATTYEQVEKAGKSPDDFWAGLSESEKLQLKYGPETVRSSMERTSFLGTAQTVLWVAAAAAAGYGAFRGIPIVSKGLGQLAAARLRGANATELLTFIEQTKMGILAKVWVPGTIAGIAGAGGWLTGAMANNMNDAFLWGPTFLDQAAQDVQKLADKQKQGSGTGSGGFTSQPERRTIIRMVTETKPQQFLGTLFSAKLGNVQQFERKLDDKITDMDDLMADVKINLNRWLASLPARLGYSVVIRKDPVDEFGAKQSGIWATLTLFQTHMSGKTLPIDTILLGPVDPKVRMEITKQTKTIEAQIPDLLTSQEVREIELPTGTVDIFGVDGERVFPGNVANIPPPAPQTPPASAGVPSGLSQGLLNFYAGLSDGNRFQINGESWAKERGTVYRLRDSAILNTTTGMIEGGSASSAPTPTTPSPAPTSSTTLRRGSKGPQVSAWQRTLNSLGENLVVDGDFGPLTEAATKRFQIRARITVDGIVGPETYAAVATMSGSGGGENRFGLVLPPKPIPEINTGLTFQ